VADKPEIGKELKRVHGTDEEARINKQLNDLEAKARADKWRIAGAKHSEWEKYHDLYRGDHWKNYQGSIPSAWRVVDNRVRRNIHIKLALLNDMNMSAEVTPREPGDEVAALLLDKAKDYTFERRAVPYKLTHAFMDALLDGTGCTKVFWNYEIDDNDVLPVPMEDVFPAPKAGPGPLVNAQNCPYIFQRKMMSFAEVKERWGLKEVPRGGPEDDTDIREDDQAGTEQGSETARHMAAAGASQPSTTTSYVPGRHIHDPGKDYKVEVQEWYLDDPDRDKYPGGRMIIRVGTQRIVEDKPNPYKHGYWPFVFGVDEIIAHRLLGQTTIRAAGPLQRELNIFDALVLANTHIQTTPRTYTFPGGIPRNKLAKSLGKPFCVETVAHPNLKPLQDYPGTLPHAVTQRRETLIKSIDDAMRVLDPVPPGARGWPQSGDVVEEMRESQQVEIRDTAKNLGQMVVGVVTLLAANTQQFYKKERYARITGPLPQALEGLNDPKTGKPIVESPNGPDGGLHYVKFNPESLKGGYDVTIVESAYRPMSMAARYDKLLKLKEVFPDDITIEDVLANIDLKGKEKILRRFRKAQAPPPPEQAPPEGGMMPPPPGMAPPGMPPMAGGMPPPGMMGPPPGGMGPPPMPGVM